MPETELQSLLDDAVSSNVFPGAQLCVASDTRLVSLATGLTAQPLYPCSVAVTTETWFDLASLTKALVTSLLLMQAVERKAVRLDDPVGRYFPELPRADEITVEHLATHRSGLLDHHPFYEQIWEESIGVGQPARQRFLELLSEHELRSKPGTVTLYSDPGYVILGWLVEKVLGNSLDVLFAEVCDKAGLGDLAFDVGDRIVASTEIDVTGRPLLGVVHDENARALGGVEGHAGLFGTAQGVMKLVRYLERTRRGLASDICSPHTVTDFWRQQAERRFAIGWDTPTEPSSAGRYTTRGQSVGHLGFTGCSVWHDMARDVTVVLVSNRVHPTRENILIRQFRPTIHNKINELVFAAGE